MFSESRNIFKSIITGQFINSPKQLQYLIQKERGKGRGEEEKISSFVWFD